MLSKGVGSAGISMLRTVDQVESRRKMKRWDRVYLRETNRCRATWRVIHRSIPASLELENCGSCSSFIWFRKLPVCFSRRYSIPSLSNLPSKQQIIDQPRLSHPNSTRDHHLPPLIHWPSYWLKSLIVKHLKIIQSHLHRTGII